jgi:hypothetical protein
LRHLPLKTRLNDLRTVIRKPARQQDPAARIKERNSNVVPERFAHRNADLISAFAAADSAQATLLWKSDIKSRTLPGGRLDPHPAAVPFGDFFAQRQPDSGAGQFFAPVQPLRFVSIIP